MLQNAYFLAKIGVDTAENEQHFAEICNPCNPWQSGQSGQAEAAAARRLRARPPHRRPAPRLQGAALFATRPSACFYRQTFCERPLTLQNLVLVNYKSEY